jgi:hypothetical protein
LFALSFVILRAAEDLLLLFAVAVAVAVAVVAVIAVASRRLSLIDFDL